MNVRDAIKKYTEDLRTFPGDAALAYRNEGTRGLWEAIASRTVHRVIRTGHLIVFAQPVGDAPTMAPPAGVTIAPVTEADWPALTTLISARELARSRALVAAGRHCLVAWRGSRPIGYAWVAESLGPDVTRCPFPLPPEAAYLWALYVLPAERCNGIGSALASARIQTARERGFREGWRTIAPSNRASLRTLQKSGGETRVVGTLRFVKVLARVFVRYTPRADVPAGIS